MMPALPQVWHGGSHEFIACAVEMTQVKPSAVGALLPALHAPAGRSGGSVVMIGMHSMLKMWNSSRCKLMSASKHTHVL